jgi:hypothetical protein
MTTSGIIPLALRQEGEFSRVAYRPPLDSIPSDESEGKRVKKVCEFFNEHLGKNRSITDIDWSPKV